MSGRREREIERRLAERRDIEPPPDLLAKLRAEIPAEVRVHQDAAGQEVERGGIPRQRWLIAASLVAMVGMGLFSLHVLRETKTEERAPAPANTAVAPPAARPAPPPPMAAPPAAVPALVEPRRQIASPAAIPAAPRRKERADSSPPAANAPRPAAPAPAPPVQPQSLPEGVPSGVVGGAPEGGAAGNVDQVAPAPQAEMKLQQAAKSEARAMSKAARPAGDGFALNGPAVAEGAPAPVAGGERRWLLLFRPEGALSPGARAEVTFDPAAVAYSRRIGAGPDLLYEVKLQPEVAASATVATLRGVAPGAPPRTLRALRLADLAPTWEQASPRFRLTSLAAELEEVLAGTRPRSDLPELRSRAQSLAGELSGDPQAADLLRRIEQARPP